MVCPNQIRCRDGLALRYGWEQKNLPISCACGEHFMSHASHCAKGGYTHLRHNEIRDTLAKLIGDVCNDVEIEPKLQPLEGETFDKSTSTDDEARLDIKANGLFDSRFCRTFFDVKIFNPFAYSCPKQIQEAYKHHEKKHMKPCFKKRKYEKRIKYRRVLSAFSSLRLQEEPDRPHRKSSQDLRSSSATNLPSHTLMS